MQFVVSRLRAGEWIAGIGAAAMLVVTFATPWYGLKGPYAATAKTLGYETTVNAWNGLATLRFLLVLTGVVGVAAWWFHATRRAPALPVSLVIVDIVLASALLLGLIY